MGVGGFGRLDVGEGWRMEDFAGCGGGEHDRVILLVAGGDGKGGVAGCRHGGHGHGRQAGRRHHARRLDRIAEVVAGGGRGITGRITEVRRGRWRWQHALRGRQRLGDAGIVGGGRGGHGKSGDSIKYPGEGLTGKK
jgi:hypothetical protein